MSMSSCCATKPSVSAVCPRCGQKGKAVGEETLTHLLTKAALSKRRDVPYLFCRTPICEVVYFSADGVTVFRKSDVRVRVGLKETEPPIPLCYCFGFTEQDVYDEVKATGRCTISERITARVQAGECACEIKNPQGSCCLGKVRAAEKEAVACWKSRRSSAVLMY